eukprot:2048485-Amphidinium_carterae.1
MQFGTSFLQSSIFLHILSEAKPNVPHQSLLSRTGSKAVLSSNKEALRYKNGGCRCTRVALYNGVLLFRSVARIPLWNKMLPKKAHEKEGLAIEAGRGERTTIFFLAKRPSKSCPLGPKKFVWGCNTSTDPR